MFIFAFRLQKYILFWHQASFLLIIYFLPYYFVVRASKIFHQSSYQPLELFVGSIGQKGSEVGNNLLIGLLRAM